MEQSSSVRLFSEVRSKTFVLTYLRKFWKYSSILIKSDIVRCIAEVISFIEAKFYPFWSETFRIMINCYNIGCFIGWLPYFQWCSETKNSSFWYGLDVSLFMISKWNIFNRRKNNMWFKISKSFLLLHFEHLLWSSFWPLEFISRLPMISLQILQK